MTAHSTGRIAQQGVTLVEIGITLAILALLIAIALPNFTVWINNAKIKTAAEAILAGMQLARTEAVRRNANVQFELGTGSSWAVSVVATAEVIQTRSENEGSPETTVTVTPAGATQVTFNGFGRVIPNADASPSITQVEVDSLVLAPAESRELRIVVGSGGNVRLCDPSYSAGDPRTC